MEATTEPKFISRLISVFLEIIGSIAEFASLALIIYINRGSFGLHGQFYYLKTIVVLLLILSVLQHHYLTKANFEKIDSLDEKDLSSLGFNQRWISKTIAEDILRVLIFILFAVLTGKVPYIIAIITEIYNKVNGSDESFDLTNFTKLYVIASFVLACCMLLWSSLAFLHNSKFALQKSAASNKIISFPFKNPVMTFLVCDVLAWFIWFCFLMMFVYENTNWYEPLQLVAAFYILIIVLRTIGHITAFFTDGGSIIFKSQRVRKNILFTGLLFVIVFFCAIRLFHNEETCANTGILSRIRTEKGALRIAFEQDSPPMTYFDKDSTGKDVYTGFGYEFARTLSSSMNIQMASPLIADFEKLPEMLYTCQADLVIAGEIEDNGMRDVLWSKPFMETELCLIVRTGYKDDNYMKLANKNKKIGITNGDWATKKWVKENIPGARIDDRFSSTNWMSHLDDGTWDAVVYDLTYAKDEVKAFNGRLRISQYGLSKISYCIIMPKGNKDLKAEIDNKIDSLRRTPFYKGLCQRYLYKDEQIARALK